MIPFGDNLDLLTYELQNVTIQNLSSAPASTKSGSFYFDTTINGFAGRDSGGYKTVGFVATSINPVALTVNGTANIGSAATQVARADHVHPMPGLASGSADGFLSLAFWNRLNNAASIATASTLAIRDINGRIETADPVAGQQAANYQWVVQQINLARAGLAFKDPVRTIFNGTSLVGTYSSGTKRLTASANGVFPANDGVTGWAINDRVALDQTSNQTNNGLYRIIDVGSAGTPWILERTSDFGGPGSQSTDILAGSYFNVKEGSEFGGTQWTLAIATVTIDTTSINFTIDTTAKVDGTTIEVNAFGNLQIKDAGVTYAKFQTIAACSVFGRSANSSGVGAAISAGSDNTVLTRSSGSLGFTSISNAMMSAMAAKSVKVNATNASAVPTDLAGTAADQVFQVNSTNTGLEWGTIRTGGITNSAVTYAKIQNVTTTNRVLGRVSAGAGVVEELTPANLQAILASAQTSGVKVAAKQYTLGDGTSTSFSLTHNENTQNIIGVFCRRVNDNSRFEAGWIASSLSAVSASFGSPPAASNIVATLLYVPN